MHPKTANKNPSNPTLHSSDLLLDPSVHGKLTKDQFQATIESRASAGDRGRDPTHLTLQKQWFVNIASFLNVRGSDVTRAMQDVDPNFSGNKEDEYRANLFLPLVMKQLARMTKSDPVLDVAPKSADPDDQFGAQVAKQLLEHFDESMNLRGKRAELALWMITCGDAFLRVDWDAAAGRELEVLLNPMSGEPEEASNVRPEMVEFARQHGFVKSRNEGDLDIEVISPFQITTPRGFTSLQAMPWIITEYDRSLDWIYDRYPKQARDIRPDDFDTSIDGQYLQRLTSLVNRHGFTMPSRGSEGNETFRVREFWHRPSKRFPKGIWGRTLRSTYLEHGPHPYHDTDIDMRRFPFMAFPVTHFQYSPAPNRFWGTSLVEHLQEPIGEYNRARSQTNKQRDRLAHPTWLAPKNAELSNLRNEYGDILEYSSVGAAPQLVPAPQISSIMVESEERALSDMRLIASQQEATQGDVPTGLRSGNAIRFLQEQDLSTLSTTFENMEDGSREIAVRQLMLTHQFMDIPRFINVTGEFAQGDAIMFKSGDLFGNMNVIVRRGSMSPRSGAEQAELITNMISSGAMNPADPREREMVFEAFGLGGHNELFYERNLDKRRAKHENAIFLRPDVDPQSGRPRPFPDVRDIDDHGAHIQEHMLFQKSDAYEALPPIRQIAFDAHVQKHQMAVAQQVQVMQAMQSQGSGGGGSQPSEKGEASPPRDRQETPGSSQGPS